MQYNAIMPDDIESPNSSEELPPFEPLSQDSFRKIREQEAENIRREYLKSTGRLPLPRKKNSSSDSEHNHLKE